MHLLWLSRTNLDIHHLLSSLCTVLNLFGFGQVKKYDGEV